MIKIDEIGDDGVVMDDGRTLSFIEIAVMIREIAMDGRPHRLPQLKVGFNGEEKQTLFEAAAIIEDLFQ